VTSPDVVVVGGGVVGAATAYYAAKANLRVRLHEARALAAEASRVNPGVVSLATKAPGRSARLARASLALFDDLEGQIGPFSLVRGGSLVVFEDDEEARYAQTRRDRLAEDEVHLEIVNGRRAREIQPLLGPVVLGAIWSQRDIIVDPLALTESFARAASVLGAEIRVGEPVRELVLDGAAIVGVRTDEGRVNASWVVNAAGIRAADLGLSVGIRHPVAPRRGQLMSVDARTAIAPVRVTSVRELLHKYSARPGTGTVGIGVTPKPDGTVILGGTTEDVGLDTTLDPLVFATMALGAVRLCPGLVQARPLRAWCGFRPYAADGPILGADPEHPGYVVAAGHGGDGVALAPVSAMYVTRIMSTGRPDLKLEQFLANG
jgi:glycine/D-amino acid oxidase-like deaminating enzyme